jgi:glycoprotein-N-acetylgalactosamine 3-beta-galactosyltransferase
LLHQYHPQTPLLFGHRFAVEMLDEGYMAGGAYILSKEAVIRFVTEALANDTICEKNENGAEDLEIGRCLNHIALFTDERDSLGQKKFFPIGVEEHMRPNYDESFWYEKSMYYPVKSGSLDCCSETPVAFHYVAPKTMYLYEYLINHVHPFGLDENEIQELPRKFTIEEILRRSDEESQSPNYKKHKTVHVLKNSEIFK